ncbi:MAG: hypothetical protein ACXW0F_06490, partial [Gaiellaceae bacterium]
GARSMVIRRILNGRIPQWLVWGLLPRVIGDTRTRGLVRRFRHSWFHRQPITKGPVSVELRRQLEDEFTPDVRLLSDLLDRDLMAFWFGRRDLGRGTTARRSAARSKTGVAQ